MARMNLPGKLGGVETAGCQAEGTFSLCRLRPMEFHKRPKTILMRPAEDTTLGGKMTESVYQVILIGSNKG